jgi:uncharacterized cupredoxin-like copper-binding protein
MRRLVAAVSLAVALAALLAGGAGANAPSRVQIVEKEYSLVLSRLQLHAGTAIVQVVNFGMDQHDVVIQKEAKGARPTTSKRLLPEERQTLHLKLAPGRYKLWCSVPGHRERGMVATLVVK